MCCDGLGEETAHDARCAAFIRVGTPRAAGADALGRHNGHCDAMNVSGTSMHGKTILYFARGEVGEDPDERLAAKTLADKLGLRGEGADPARLDPIIADVVKGYAVRVSDHYYLCGLVGFHKRMWNSLDVRDDLREQASAEFRRWARLLTPPHEMDFVSFDESQRLWSGEAKA
jgi:hypothetical protein